MVHCALMRNLRATPPSVRPELVEGLSSTSPDGAEESAMLRQAQHERTLRLGEQTLRDIALSEIEATRFIPEKGRNRLRSHGRRSPGLAGQPPAGMGRAAGTVRASHVRRTAGRSGGQCAHPASHFRRHRGCLACGRCGGVSRRGCRWKAAQSRRLRNGHRHPRCLVRQRQHPCLRAGIGRMARTFQPSRPLSGRQRPASRLVPVEPAGKLRHARPCAVQGGADPRFHDGRGRTQDVQIARQHRRSP